MQNDSASGVLGLDDIDPILAALYAVVGLYVTVSLTIPLWVPILQKLTGQCGVFWVRTPPSHHSTASASQAAPDPTPTRLRRPFPRSRTTRTSRGSFSVLCWSSFCTGFRRCGTETAACARGHTWRGETACPGPVRPRPRPRTPASPPTPLPLQIGAVWLVVLCWRLLSFWRLGTRLPLSTASSRAPPHYTADVEMLGAPPDYLGRVLLVGNGPSIRSRGMGAKIDSFDTVVRYGNRTSKRNQPETFPHFHTIMSDATTPSFFNTTNQAPSPTQSRPFLTRTRCPLAHPRTPLAQQTKARLQRNHALLQRTTPFSNAITPSF